MILVVVLIPGALFCPYLSIYLSYDKNFQYDNLMLVFTNPGKIWRNRSKR